MKFVIKFFINKKFFDNMIHFQKTKTFFPYTYCAIMFVNVAVPSIAAETFIRDILKYLVIPIYLRSETLI